MYRSWDLSDGKWNDVRGFRHFSLDVTGIRSDIRLYGTNGGSPTVDVGKGHEIGETITMDGLTEIEMVIGFIRAEPLDDGEMPERIELLGVE